MENYPQFSSGEQNNQNQNRSNAQDQQAWQEQSFNQNYQVPSQPANQYPDNEAQNPAMHFFLYLISFFSLCFLSTGAGAILFQLINKNFSDTLRYDVASYFSQYAIKYGIAALIIATPVYFILMYLIGKYIQEGKISENSKVRKWLTYIVLFLAAGTILGDLVSLVYNMLGGDMIARFILKVIVVLFIAGSIFAYYLIDMKRKNMAGQRYEVNRILAGTALFLVIIIAFSGFTIVDSPFASRDKKIDQQTVSDLQSVDGQILNYYRENAVLPTALDDVKQNSSYYPNKKLNESITYQKIDKTDYKLCADFKRSASEYKTEQSRAYYESDDQWQYRKGNTCFNRSAEKITPTKTNITPPVSGNTFEAQMNARKASVKSIISSIVPAAIICRDASGTVTSGKGGDKACSSKDTIMWPRINFCGANSGDTQWIVQKGNIDEWNVTLSCKDFPYCDGPSNALCNKMGCKFGGSCQ